MDLRNAVPLLLAWLAILCATIGVPAAETLPFRLTFLGPDALFTAFVEAQVGFMLLLWPLFLGNGSGRERAARLAALFVVSAPLLLVAANLSNAGASSVVQTQLLVASIGALAAGIDAFLGKGAAPGYYLAVFLLSAFVPFAAFLSREFGGPDLSGLSLVSPFWAAARPSFGSPALFGGLALALLAAGRWLRREVDPPAAPG